MAFIFLKMEIKMYVIGKMIYKMDLVQNILLIEYLLKVYLKTVKPKELFFILKEIYMKENGKTLKKKGMEEIII